MICLQKQLTLYVQHLAYISCLHSVCVQLESTSFKHFSCAFPVCVV